MCRFLFNGGVSTASHFVVMFLMIGFGSPAVVASSVGAAVGAVVDYFAHYRFTFHSRKSHSTAMLLYALVALIGWFLNLLLFAFFSSWLALSPLWSQMATTSILALANYCYFKKRVFL